MTGGRVTRGRVTSVSAMGGRMTGGKVAEWRGGGATGGGVAE